MENRINDLITSIWTTEQTVGTRPYKNTNQSKTDLN